MKLKLIPLCAILAILATSCVSESQKQALLKQGYDSGARFVRDSLAQVDPFRVPPTNPPDDGHYHDYKITATSTGRVISGILAIVPDSLHKEVKGYLPFVALNGSLDSTDTYQGNAKHPHLRYEVVTIVTPGPDGKAKANSEFKLAVVKEIVRKKDQKANHKH